MHRTNRKRTLLENDKLYTRTLTIAIGRKVPIVNPGNEGGVKTFCKNLYICHVTLKKKSGMAMGRQGQVRLPTRRQQRKEGPKEKARQAGGHQ